LANLSKAPTSRAPGRRSRLDPARTPPAGPTRGLPVLDRAKLLGAQGPISPPGAARVGRGDLSITFAVECRCRQHPVRQSAPWSVQTPPWRPGAGFFDLTQIAKTDPRKPNR